MAWWRFPKRWEISMADKNIIIGHVINVTGMLGVLSGIVLFTFVIVLLLFRYGFGLDTPNWFH
jgi:hypothetical protein